MAGLELDVVQVIEQEVADKEAQTEADQAETEVLRNQLTDATDGLVQGWQNAKDLLNGLKSQWNLIKSKPDEYAKYPQSDRNKIEWAVSKIDTFLST